MSGSHQIAYSTLKSCRHEVKGKNPSERRKFRRVSGELRKNGLAGWSGLDLNLRDPSISLPVIMVSIVQPMKTRFAFEQTSNLSHGHAFR